MNRNESIKENPSEQKCFKERESLLVLKIQMMDRRKRKRNKKCFLKEENEEKLFQEFKRKQRSKDKHKKSVFKAPRRLEDASSRRGCKIIHFLWKDALGMKPQLKTRLWSKNETIGFIE